jgi:hypothetical protein
MHATITEYGILPEMEGEQNTERRNPKNNLMVAFFFLWEVF